MWSRFKVDREKININLKQGETKELEIEIKNTGNIRAEFNLSLTDGIDEIVELAENNFEILSFESSIIKLKFSVLGNVLPGLYTGKLKIKSGDIEKEVLITVSVSSEETLFDVGIEIPSKYQKVKPGAKFGFNVKIFNLGEEVDASIEYEIRDSNGDKIFFEKEDRKINNELSFTKEVVLSEDIAYETYILYVKVIYEDKIANASAYFDVVEGFSFISILIIIITTFLTLFLIKKNLRKIRN